MSRRRPLWRPSTPTWTNLATKADVATVKADLGSLATKADVATVKADIYRAMLVQTFAIAGMLFAVLRIFG